MNAPQATNSNDKVTLAVLSTKLDIVIAKLDKVDCAVDEIKIEQGVHTTEIANIHKDIDENVKPDVKQLRNRDTWWSSINSIAITIGTILGIRN